MPLLNTFAVSVLIFIHVPDHRHNNSGFDRKPNSKRKIITALTSCVSGENFTIAKNNAAKLPLLCEAFETVFNPMIIINRGMK